MELSRHIRATGMMVMLLLAGSVGAVCPPGDLNRDCRVDHLDLALLAAQWLSEPNGIDDLSDDAIINAVDLAVLANHWREIGCPIVINELLAHSHGPAPDWVELHNISSVPVDISGWFLSDDERDLYQFQIEDGTVIEPNGYVLFYEDTQFGNPYHPGTRSRFALSKYGEMLSVYSGDDERFGGCLVLERFGPSETWVTFGRHQTSMGTYVFVPMSEPTPGRANAHPLVGPLVINEIMYNPPGHPDAQYVELLNVSGTLLALLDFWSLETWRFTTDGGIDFAFSREEPVMLEPGEHILLVKDAARVRQMYTIPAHAQIFEWGPGRLSDRGERMCLLKPKDVDDAGRQYWIEVDWIHYSNGTPPEDSADGADPWPSEADGLGPSLNRIFPSQYGDDPGNWHATIPTPGSTND